ncbi:MAG: extracellular solute-binding protein [Lachnospiraceae bacterium]|nr:extracellular solute-binding protein [Lachnospiraceae bacterium]
MNTRKMSALLLVMIMLLTCLTGCGKTNSDDSTGTVNGAGGTDAALSGNDVEGGTDLQQAGVNSAMGRYVEEVTELGDRVSWYGNRLCRLSNGQVVLSDIYRTFLVSDDNGATWEEDDAEWHARMFGEGKYASQIAIGTDNTAAVIYDDGSYDEETGQYTQVKRFTVIRPDGTEHLIDIPVSGNDKNPYNVEIADSGRIFVSITGSSDIYEVKEDGSCEYFMTVQGESPEIMKFQGNLMFLNGHDYNQLLIYDMEKKEYVEDEVLIDFLKENYSSGNLNDNFYDGSRTYQMYFFTGEEGVIYIAGKKGLHRHAIGGDAMEQIIDGSLCTFSNPSYEIVAMAMLEDNVFLTLFTDGRLVRYVYDPDVATVPADKLKVYSLKENDTIRQAVALFMTAYPNAAVEYEVGIEEGSSVTREDALKKLNTKIMAGEGPDVLILDDMPIDSYIEKGMLMDLSTILGSLSGEEEVFDSIVQAMKKDDKVYAMPCEIQIPVMMGAEKYISQIKDLESIADMMEEMRRDNPGKDLLGICTEKGIMRYFAMSCVPAWTTESGELDRGAIMQFLEQTKRIYDAQTDGLPEEIIESYKTSNELWLEYWGEFMDDAAILRTIDNGIDYIVGSTQLTYSALASTRAYDETVSVNKVEGFEGSKWAVMNGQSSNVFCAKTLFGINAISENSSLAENFLRLCLGKENQSNLFYGLAVNKAAFDGNFIPGSWVNENGRYGWVSRPNDEGMEITLNIYQSNEEQIADLRKCVEAAETPYIEDTVLEYAVYDEGILYMQGVQSLDEAVSAIEKKISIYMAE